MNWRINRLIFSSIVAFSLVVPCVARANANTQADVQLINATLIADLPAVQQALEAGARPDVAVGPEGKVAFGSRGTLLLMQHLLHRIIAGEQRFEPILRALLTSAAKLHVLATQNVQGDTALHTAARLGLCKLLDTPLREDRAPLHTKNNQGQVPLHLAVYFDNFPCVLLLMEKASEECKTTDNRGKSPFVPIDLPRLVGIAVARGTLFHLHQALTLLLNCGLPLGPYTASTIYANKIMIDDIRTKGGFEGIEELTQGYDVDNLGISSGLCFGWFSKRLDQRRSEVGTADSEPALAVWTLPKESVAARLPELVAQQRYWYARAILGVAPNVSSAELEPAYLNRVNDVKQYIETYRARLNGQQEERLSACLLHLLDLAVTLLRPSVQEELFALLRATRGNVDAALARFARKYPRDRRRLQEARRIAEAYR